MQYQQKEHELQVAKYKLEGIQASKQIYLNTYDYQKPLLVEFFDNKWQLEDEQNDAITEMSTANEQLQARVSELETEAEAMRTEMEDQEFLLNETMDTMITMREQLESSTAYDAVVSDQLSRSP
jgi:ABC-type phosphate transport system auxiliary subunit